MARRKAFNAEQVVAKLREVEVLMAQGKGVILACKEARPVASATGLQHKTGSY